MKMNDLEVALIKRFLADGGLAPARRSIDVGAVIVSDRDDTGAGFVTTFARCDELKLFADDASMRWGRVGARLNSLLDTGYVIYVDDGYVTALEGYTYGDEWPERVTQIELYDIEPGMELTIPRP